MTLYTLAMLYYVTNGKLSLYKIWENQELSVHLKSFINELSKQLYSRLEADCPNTTTFRDFCKSAKTWSMAKSYTFSLDFASIRDDMKKSDEDAIRRQSAKEHLEKERKQIESLGVVFWDGLSTIVDGTYTELECKTMSDIVEQLKVGKQLSTVLVFEGTQIYKKFCKTGKDKNDVIALSSIKQRKEEKDSLALYKRIQQLSDEDWSKIRLVVGRACSESDTKIVKKVSQQKDKSKLTYKQLVVICRALDQINIKFKEQIKKAY